VRLHTDEQAQCFHQEYEMFRSNLATYPETNAGYSYVENVFRAAFALIAAILAVTPFQSNANTAKPAASDYADTQTRAELYRLAREVESISPNQAAELRYLAR
jgi:hypothetical protein